MKFRTHILAYFSLITFLLSAVFVYSYSQEFRRHQFADLTVYGESITRNTAFTAGDFLINEDYAPLQQFIEEFSNRPWVKRVTIADSTGIILADSDRNRLGSKLTDLQDLESINEEKPHIRQSLEKRELAVISQVTVYS